MPLRTRILLSLVLLALIPLMLFGITAYAASTSSLIAVERSNLEGAVDSVSRAVHDIRNGLGDTTRDYASWDDLHSQIANNDPATSDFIMQNFDPSSTAAVSVTYGLNVMGIFDINRKANYSYGPMDVVLPRLEREHDDLLKVIDPVVTLEVLGNDVYIVSLAPVRDSKAENPNGFLALGRKLSTGDMEQIKVLTGFDVALYRDTTRVATTQEMGVTPSPDLLKKAASGEEVLDQSNATLSLAYSPIKTSNGATAATLVIWRPRTSTIAAQSSLSSTLLIGFIFGGILAVIVALALQRSITQPLISLANSADRIAAGDLNSRVPAPAKANDEVGRLANAFNQMAAKVSQRVSDSETEKQRLREMDEYRLNLLNAITEELHSPIDTVKSYVESLGSEMYGSLNEAQRRLVTAADRSISIQKALVADLTDFGSAQRGKLQMRRERISLDKLAPETVAVVQERYTKKNIQFTSSVANNVPPVFADRIRTAQIFEHLLDWAGDFSLPGGRVGLTAIVEPGIVRISVTDTSRGLTEEERARVFDLFYLPEGMHDSATTPNGSSGTNGSNGTPDQQAVAVKVGTVQGLGLALAKALIEQHGGTISVASEKNKGNTFTFTLPTTN